MRRARQLTTVPLAVLLAAVGVLVSTLAGDSPSTLPASTNPAAISHDDSFRKLLRERLDVELPKRFSLVTEAVDWEGLRREAGKADDLETRKLCLALVELWKRLAEAHDYGMMCSRPNVFEWMTCELLAGTHKPGKRLPYANLGLPTVSACDYILAEGELPRWAKSLRVCAAGVLAGEGKSRGMGVLLDAVRAGGKREGFDPIHEALHAAATEKALPLWADAARDAEPRVRLTVVRQVGTIQSAKAVPVLVSLLKDEDREVRMAAAMVLMPRDVKDAAPVLLEKVRRELDGKPASAHAAAPICRKLSQWNVADVPWEKIEAVLNDKSRADPADYWRAVEVAGECLAAGREKVALPFLISAMTLTEKQLDLLPNLGTPDSAELSTPWHAATILASRGRAEGVELIRRYMEVGRLHWNYADEGLRALAAYLDHAGTTPAGCKAAMAIAAKAVARHGQLFQGYFWRGLEALGEMGALVRVERVAAPAGEADRASPHREYRASEVISLPYTRKYGSPGNERYMMLEIYRAKVRSVAVAARQEGVVLPPRWMEAYEKSQQKEIEALAMSLNEDMRRAAIISLSEILGRPYSTTLPASSPGSSVP